MGLKIWLYLLSLWLLFIFVFFITLKMPVCSNNCEFIGFKQLLFSNIVPFICLVLLILGIAGYFLFDFKVKGSHELPFAISDVEPINYEHLTFLATYIIPLISIDFDKTKAPYIFFGLIVVMGAIYVRTDLFYANPSLALLGFKIYKANGAFRNNESRNAIILITKDNLSNYMSVSYIKLDERIYYVEGKV
ncbi:anti-phage protein KwaA [Acinetobacter modestus]|uniref:anti-phage protein KwaA n=1 Tax=Acinetobacter modestus TaxID=1776740 RepID=UPI00320ACC99